MKPRKKPDSPISESCSCAGANLDRLLQPAILSILVKDRLNGYRIGKTLETMAMFQRRKPDASGLYRTLKDMERRNLIAPVAAKQETADAKAYAITEDGILCLGRWVQTLTSYRQAMGDLLEHCQSVLPTASAAKNIRSHGCDSGRGRN